LPPAITGEQVALLGMSVVEQLSVDALQKGGALID
jgi:hypothetical protein